MCTQLYNIPPKNHTSISCFLHVYLSFQLMCNLLSAMKIGVSSSYFNTKSTEYGACYNEELMKRNVSDICVTIHEHTRTICL